MIIGEKWKIDNFTEKVSLELDCHKYSLSKGRELSAWLTTLSLLANRTTINSDKWNVRTVWETRMDSIINK